MSRSSGHRSAFFAVAFFLAAIQAA
jgi:hypothetical protein